MFNLVRKNDFSFKSSSLVELKRKSTHATHNLSRVLFSTTSSVVKNAEVLISERGVVRRRIHT